MVAWSFLPTLLVMCAGVLVNQQPPSRGPAVPPSLRQIQEGTGSHSIPLTLVPRPALTLTAKSPLAPHNIRVVLGASICDYWVASVNL